MALTRRQFLTLTGGSAAAAVIFQACGVPEDELLVQSPFEMPEDAVTGLQNWYATTCRQCPTGEGLVVKVMEGRAKKVEGNVDHPINRGRHSARCEASLQALYHPDRIKGPLVRAGERGSGQFEEISWTDAISRLTLQLRNLSESGNQSNLAMVTAPLGGHLGWLYFGVALVTGAVFVALAWQLWRGQAAPMRLFFVSIVYLFALFAAVGLDVLV